MDVREMIETSGVDVWTFLEAAIEVAAADHQDELRRRRDSFVKMLYNPQLLEESLCRSCVIDRDSPNDGVVNDIDPFGGLFDDHPRRLLRIKAQLDSPDQTEDALVDMLQSLVDMDITFQALQETDIGRNVNKLRKHPSNEVRRLVKQLVRKWKEIVDEWVSTNHPGEAGSSALIDGDSPQQKLPQNGHHQVSDFGYSPNPQYGSSGLDRNDSEPERKPKPIPKREAPVQHKRPSPASGSTPNVPRQREQRDNAFESDRLASARRRLQDNYKEVENAKKQRTIQVMDIHEIPKTRNSFIKKGGGSMGKHW